MNAQATTSQRESSSESLRAGLNFQMMAGNWSTREKPAWVSAKEIHGETAPEVALSTMT